MVTPTLLTTGSFPIIGYIVRGAKRLAVSLAMIALAIDLLKGIDIRSFSINLKAFVRQSRARN
jgi:hypothetical protein